MRNKNDVKHNIIVNFIIQKFTIMSNITIVYFIFQKLKNKYTFPKEYTNWEKLSSLNLTKREETKTRYFAPRIIVFIISIIWFTIRRRFSNFNVCLWGHISPIWMSTANLQTFFTFWNCWIQGYSSWDSSCSKIKKLMNKWINEQLN